ncbi:maleate cis-trans isomerase family protein [Nitratireductor basaltis]|uniref:Ectoine utilization protein EutA n=1 Tax=Nitratireductor basaltis TaxID=472175 RepID=A0A084UCU7_9HYPH|nr:aspartate/glutamate racemase family protein [Nitratireductor basaltis]KFB10783.1 Ectoine utilization protein EutA [Nitratireductor basaltis]
MNAPTKPVIGTILLATDLVTENDIRAIVPPHVTVCATRVPFENPTSPEQLRRTLPHLGEAARWLVPGVELGALYFSCTSATVVLGEDNVARAIGETRPEVKPVTPIMAAKRAFRALGAKKIAVMTPYIASTAKAIVDHLEEHGFEVLNAHGLNMEDDRDMARLPAEPIIEAAEIAMVEGAEALFISCTALPAATLVPEIERRIGIPVVTSNLAGLWMSMRRAGVTDRLGEKGKLLDLDLPEDAA